MLVAQEKIQWQEPVKHKSPVKNSRPARKRKQFAKLRSIIVLALVVGLTGSIGAATIQLTVVQGAQVRNLEKEITVIKAQKDLLKMDADKLHGLSRIESAALAMGMVRPVGTVYVAATVPAVNNQEGTQSSQATALPAVVKPTALQQFSQIFTSFFASTQR